MLLKPKFILLDEPFAGIDPLSIEQIKKFILRACKYTGVLVTDHQVVSTLDICDTAMIIYKGKTICTGSPNTIIQNKDVKELYLGH